MRISRFSTKWLVKLLIISGLALSGCRSNKTIPYFKNIPESEYSQIAQAKFVEPKILKGDIISVYIKTADPASVAAINSGANQEGTGAAGRDVIGYKVDKQGEIEIPILGNFKVEGLTTSEVRDLVRQKANTLYNDPTVQVRFVNFKISIIGEVSKPNNYNVADEKINVLDAIAMAGDLTPYGKRENVLLIRETDGGDKEMVRFNLNDAKIFSSPYYYLKQNDIIYVEPSKAMIANTERQKITIITACLGVLSTLLVLLTRTNVL
ncbi:polysaccharide biosynthesis/export family protein [Olivibacter sitiensis]|uniref:polysaccharide biosynthesis/export family protein n=1 Tax=Olivibacter sitiensis TaxID=376470 RepID=UPI00048076D4|nr:polysaccharide biosynthesis/export family protein [Olivibacter sitiensis]